MQSVQGSTQHVNTQSLANFTPDQKTSFLHDASTAGWHLHPERPIVWEPDGAACSCGNPEGCPGAGKHPDGKWSDPLNPLHPNTRNIIGYRVGRLPLAGWLVHLGLSRLMVVDVDARHDGIRHWGELAAAIGMAWADPFARSGSGGFHYLFRAPDEVDARRGFVGPNGMSLCRITPRPGVDILCGQASIVLPFSPHRSGGWYTLLRWPAPIYDPTPLLPLWLASPKFAASVPPAATPGAGAALDAGPGCSPVDRARAYLAKSPGPTCGTGTCHARTFWAACVLVKDFQLTTDEAFAVLSAWTATGTHAWTDGELWHKLAQAFSSPGDRGKLLNAQRERKQAPWELELSSLLAWVPMGRILHLVDGAGHVLDTRPAPIEDRQPQWLDGIVENLLHTPRVTLPDLTQDESAGLTSCPTPRCVLMSHLHDGREMIQEHGCRHTWCPFCWPAKQEHIRATITHHLADLCRTDPEQETLRVYWFTCQRESWTRVQWWLRRRCANYFALATTALGDDEGHTIAVFTTVLPPGMSAMSMPPAEAVTYACRLVDNLPSGIKCRIYTSSRAWKLLAEPKRDDPCWKKVGQLASTPAQQQEVLTDHGLPVQNARGGGPWWHWVARIFRPCHVEREHLRFELNEGCRLPEFINYGNATAHHADEVVSTITADHTIGNLVPWIPDL